jgi:hypothetical protein
MAATRADAYSAFDRFVTVYAAKYPTATEALKKDRMPFRKQARVAGIDICKHRRPRRLPAGLR